MLFAASDDCLAVVTAFLAFIFVAAMLGLSDACFRSVCELDAVLARQPAEVQPSSVACGR